MFAKHSRGSAFVPGISRESNRCTRGIPLVKPTGGRLIPRRSRAHSPRACFPDSGPVSSHWRYQVGSNHRGGTPAGRPDGRGETPTLQNCVARSAVVSTAGTRASSPVCCQGGGGKLVDARALYGSVVSAAQTPSRRNQNLPPESQDVPPRLHVYRIVRVDPCSDRRDAVAVGDAV